jgi:hypothetical protein
VSVLRRGRRAAAVVLGLMLVVSLFATSSVGQATPQSDKQSIDCLAGTPPTGSVMPKPFLKLPFRARDGAASLYDTQAWFTSPDELDIDDEENGAVHAANDLELVRQHDFGYGLPILAAASGRAYFSYQYISGSWATHQVGWGAGLFVEIRHAQDQPGNAGWVSQYIHVSRVAPGIPYLPPTRVDDPNDPEHPDWAPSGILQDNNTLWNFGVPVQQGQVIGYMGDTGIGLDWKDSFDPNTGLVAPRNRNLLKPWDPPQVHFQLYQGRINGAKQNIVDPFGWYAQVCPGEWRAGRPHVNPYGQYPGKMRAAKATAWLTDQHGRLQYAAP